MKKVELLNTNGDKVKEISLNEEVFGIVPNDKVLYDAVILTRASLRQGTADTKTRSLVSGGGRKPWKQKGTGHARQGSIRAVQWRGGGIAFGPHPRDYSKKMNRKERRLAIKSALTYMVPNMMVVESISFDKPKTSEALKFLETYKVSDKKVIIVMNELSENVILATRNLPNVLLLESDEINVLDLVTADNMIIEQDALKSIEEVLK